MCVIFWVNKERPTQGMVEKAFDHNDDGAGIAHRTVNDAGEPVVEWKKGLDVKQMIELCATLPIPYIAHFRIASIGGIRDSLTHPFPITRSGSLALSGQTKGYVLFHNGHWKEWNAHCLQAAGARDADGKVIQIPMGRWSDTRAMAWLCSIYGPGFMEFLPDQKGIIFGPKDMQIFDGNGWEKIKVNSSGDFVWCSNDYFMKGQTVSGSGEHKQAPMQLTQVTGAHTPIQTPGRGLGVGAGGRFCRYDMCANQTLDTKGYCFLHPNGVARMVSTTPERQPVVMGPATGGSRVPPSPFVQPITIELPQGEAISVELAEYLHNEKQLSRNKLKKIKRHWELATSTGKKSGRSLRVLLQMTKEIQNSSHGLVR